MTNNKLPIIFIGETKGGELIANSARIKRKRPLVWVGQG